ncbi:MULTISPECIES: DUF488 family protein [Ensifer]|jgi:uncharacterized protein YeaO (DUF488 family)|uniref:DUF488 domain-containing protein n=1 Tax=Ensifer TaxID=106591 RepID=UPI000715D689|nr:MULTISPECIES: DUF488 family protein [Ensifer]KSV70507.1 hypothetical protein N185_25550 [Sinorhizobium sp. GW3]OWZ95785.1 hypothetical protein B9J07_02915 [Sinorhizobium sp. LM21]KQZ56090.1 hypothetical protein ASD63_24665 [Ensifer sp. Root558]MBD9628063.1 DUF488 family protein [Ensifer sp. ENS06]MBW0368990.1 DUF488 family protein [Ensifer adhaerens]
MQLKTKRVYEPKADGDGMRVLVDRLWPRGLTKAEAAVDLWLKDIAPTTELRRWFHADEGTWEEFRERYLAELDGNPVAVDLLRQRIAEGPVTLLYSVKDEARNHAEILKGYILTHR